MNRFLILDDHDVVREGLKRILNPGTVYGEASTPGEALQLLQQQDWDLVIFDPYLRGSGLEVLKQLKQIRPLVPVLIFSKHSDMEYARRALSSGAAGFIPKDSPVEELVKAIQKVIEGGLYISPAIAEGLVLDLQTSDRPRHRALSNREFEVMCLIGSGKTIGQIAGLFELSAKTVSTYRGRMVRFEFSVDVPGPFSQTASFSLTPKLGMANGWVGSGSALRRHVSAQLIPYVGSADANQLVESVADDKAQLGWKVESLLCVFLGRTVGTRLANRIISDFAAVE
jgi:two-component system, NarL family, invasion response regulator UvrY